MLRRYLFAGQDEPVLVAEGDCFYCSTTKYLSPDHHGSIVAHADCAGTRTNLRD